MGNPHQDNNDNKEQPPSQRPASKLEEKGVRTAAAASTSSATPSTTGSSISSRDEQDITALKRMMAFPSVNGNCNAIKSTAAAAAAAAAGGGGGSASVAHSVTTAGCTNDTTLFCPSPSKKASVNVNHNQVNLPKDDKSCAATTAITIKDKLHNLEEEDAAIKRQAQAILHLTDSDDDDDDDDSEQDDEEKQGKVAPCPPATPQTPKPPPAASLPGAFSGAPGEDLRHLEKVRFSRVGTAAGTAIRGNHTNTDTNFNEKSGMDDSSRKQEQEASMDDSRRKQQQYASMDDSSKKQQQNDPWPSTQSATHSDSSSKKNLFNASSRYGSSRFRFSSFYPSKMSLSQQPQSPSTANLAVARLVTEPSISWLPQADAVITEELQEKQARSKRSVLLSLTGIALVVVVLVMVVVFSVVLTRPNTTIIVPMQSTNTSGHATVAPSPMSPQDYLSSLLPAFTLETVNKHPTSPQALAFDFILQDPLLDNYTDWRIQQRFAVASLYYSTNGEGWFQNTNWLNHSVHECDWFFQIEYKDTISVDSIRYTGEVLLHPRACGGHADVNQTQLYDIHLDLHIEHVFLESNNLVGSLPPELFFLTKLQSLDLSRNQLSGSLPSQIGDLTLLQGLDLSGNLMTNLLPTELGQLKSLANLTMTNNQFQGTIISELGQLTLLKRLIMDSFDLQSGTLPVELSYLVNLQAFVFSECNLTGTFPTWLNGSNFRNLTGIWLDGNNLNGTIATHLSTLSNLEYFDLSLNQFSGTVPSWINGSTFPKLRFFSLWASQMTGTIPSGLALLSNLVDLDFDENQLTGYIPTELGLLPLESLWLSENFLTGPIPSELGLITTMLYVGFGANQLSGMMPPELASWVNITYFNVSDNPFLSGTIPDAFCELEADMLGVNCTAIFCGCHCPCLSFLGSNGED